VVRCHWTRGEYVVGRFQRCPTSLGKAKVDVRRSAEIEIPRDRSACALPLILLAERREPPGMFFTAARLIGYALHAQSEAIGSHGVLSCPSEQILSIASFPRKPEVC
jgi:hypothetical protein